MLHMTKMEKELVDFIMAGIPAEGEYYVKHDIVTDTIYGEGACFRKGGIFFEGIVGEREGKEVPAFCFAGGGGRYVGDHLLYLTLGEMKKEYPRVYAIMMAPEREPSFAPCVEGDYEDPGFVVL